jgi:hypothetical protein
VRFTTPDAAQPVGLLCPIASGVEYVPGLLHAEQPHQVGGGPERAAVDLGQSERGFLGGDHQIGGAGDADAAAETEAVHGGDHRHGAIVDGRERVVAAAVHRRDQAAIARQLFDVDSGAEAAPIGGDHHHAHGLVAAQRAHGLGQVRPAGGRQRVHRRMVQHDLRDPPGCSHRRTWLPYFFASD